MDYCDKKNALSKGRQVLFDQIEAVSSTDWSVAGAGRIYSRYARAGDSEAGQPGDKTGYT